MRHTVDVSPCWGPVRGLEESLPISPLYVYRGLDDDHQHFCTASTVVTHSVSAAHVLAFPTTKIRQV